ncbi:MAG: alpha-2-macroglobulin family protein [Verrucomicrobiota bacterium]
MKTPSTCLILALSTLLGSAAPRDAEWGQVKQHLAKDLPKSAIAVLTTIDQQARAESAWPEALRATAQRVLLEGRIAEGRDAVGRIKGMDAELAKAPAPMQPMLQSIQALWLWEYFYQNRWQFMQRTQTADKPGDDIQTWDLKRILGEIDARFNKALANREELRKTAVGDYDILLAKGTAPDALRPTLYDFLVHQILDFYSIEEQVNAAAEDSFSFNNSSPAFGTSTEFLAWKPLSTDEKSWKLKAIMLYQELLAFHQADVSPRIHVDLQRLGWAKNALTGGDADKRLEERLNEIIKATAGNELQSLARANLAHLLIDQKRMTEAREIAIAGRDAFPDSSFRSMCVNAIETIERKEISVSTELVWNAAKPQFELQYRNVNKLWFRLYPKNWSPDHNDYSYFNDDGKSLKKLLATQPAKEWSVDLAATPDFLAKSKSLDTPPDLAKGCYELIASATADFSLAKNRLECTRVWVSDLALVTGSTRGRAVGYVRNALTGEPVKAAKVELWTYNNKPNAWALSQTIATDADGHFSAKGERLVARVIYQDDALAGGQSWGYGGEEDHRVNSVYLFTDRALYRPGQTIRFKGIAASYDRQKNDYHSVNNKNFEVIFQDLNDKDIAKLTVKSNDFGSFSGSFTAPTDRVLGQAYLRCGDDTQGLRIEEYKRPKFYAEVGPAKAEPKLGDKVVVTAKALSYTGAAIDGAKVKWSVTRRAIWPDWCHWCWWFVPRDSAAKQIAHGELVSKPDGTFDVGFVAEPDSDIAPSEEPVFSYQVNVEVTDSTGETRSATRAVKAGYVGVKAALTAGAWQEVARPVKLSITTTTVDDLPVSAKGTLTVHRLQQPAAVLRPRLTMPWYGRAERKDPANPNSWELGEVVQKSEFATDKDGKTTTEIKLGAGEYRALLETADAAGKKVTALLPLRVLDPQAASFPVRIPHHFSMKSQKVLPGEEFVALWGTGYDKGRVHYEIEQRGKILQQGWSDPAKTQELLRFPVTEALRGGFQLRVLFVHDNRTYEESITVDVPWSKHDLTLKFESMRSKLEPGAKETWSVLVEGSEKNAVEMLGTLYDASLDAFTKHQWPTSLSRDFYRDINLLHLVSVGGLVQFQNWERNWNPQTGYSHLTYRHFVMEVLNNWFTHADGSVWFDARPGGSAGGLGRAAGHGMGGGALFGMLAKNKSAVMDNDAVTLSAAPASAPMAAASIVTNGLRSGDGAVTRNSIDAILNNPERAAATDPDLSKVSARKNLQETAFFEPNLTTDDKGVVKMTFTMPEALTKWRFMGFAHDAKLRSGYLEGETITAKDLMAQPNPPRFLREGDEIEFTVKISNQSDKPQSGKAKLSFADAATLESRDAALALANQEQPFEIPAKESKTLGWRIKVPDGAGFLTYKAVAATGSLSDGEEGMIAVLSKRQLVTESITLPISNAGAREFELRKLLESGKSDTLKNEALTVQVVSQPAWYAVMALPYLMEFPHECAEQLFNRYYANQLARHIAQSDPKIHRVFELWRNAPKTLDSPLLKNQDLKSLMIEETPWLRDGNSETEARRNVGVLFDDNRLDSEMARAMQRLQDMQLDSGAWPWFPGGRASDYITLYIVTGTGRLKHLGVKINNDLALRALDWLDAQIRHSYEQIKRKDRDSDHFSSFVAMYLYGRSFYLDQRPLAASNKEAVDYFLKQGAKYWMDNPSLMTRCHTALGLWRFGDKQTPPAIIKSLSENALNTDELGMHWRLNEGYYWNQAPVETQAMIIEAFREVANDMKAVDDCQVWLLKQKQTQGWKTTKSTADAVYALLLGGDVKRLASDALVKTELGGVEIKPENVEPGTGFYEKKFHATEIKPAMGKIKLTKTDAGVSWGSLHWQYLEDVSKITPHEGTPLEVKKSLFVKRMTKEGAKLEAVTGALKPGDEIVTRIEIRVDRDMEYIHLKNQRGSGVEPVNVLSQYKWQDGLGYYEMTKDTADHFFFERLPRGTHVFETSARVQLRGSYPTGIAEIQCMYAPEFNSHSASVMMKVE